MDLQCFRARMKYIFIVRSIFITIVGMLLWYGCNGQDEDELRVIVDEVIKSVEDSGDFGDLSGLKDSEVDLRDIEVYIDRSYSMRPYILGAQAPGIPDSLRILPDLINTMSDFVSSQITFNGFGYKQRDDESQLVQERPARDFLLPDTYTFANNDYASLFRRFQNDGTTRIIISDGVQSDPDEGARLGEVADALYSWVQGGGTFAIFLYRTIYRGQYYSDLRGPDPVYNCNDRPVLVFVLAPSSAAISGLRERLSEHRPPDHLIQISGRHLSLVPRDRVVSDDPRAQVNRVLHNYSSPRLFGYRSIYQVRVNNRSGEDNDRYVPIQLDVGADLNELPWKILGADRTIQFMEELDFRVDGWKVNRLQIGRESSDSTVSNVIEALPEIDILYSDVDPVNGASRVSGDSVYVRFEIPMRKPAGPEINYAFVVTAMPSETNARDLVPESYSTNDDLPASSCSQILKLRRLVAYLMVKNYVPAQSLLYADWR